MNRRLRLIFGILLGVSFVVSFQNCTQPADLGYQDRNVALAEKTDFAYDATIDQIAYMSCPRVLTDKKVPVDSDLYFTFRAGAYRFGGLKLTDQFFQTVQKKIPDRMADILHMSPANRSTVPQLAIRKTGSLNSIVSGPGEALQNVEYSNLMAALGSLDVSSTLVNNGIDPSSTTLKLTQKRTRYMRDGTGRGAHFEGNLNFGSSESLQNDLRAQYLGTGAALLALTYLEPTSGGGPDGGTPVADTNVRSPGTVFPDKNPNLPGLAYGTGYQLTFAQPVAGAVGFINGSGVQETPYPSNILTMVTERNLQTGAQNSAQWVCPESLRFKVIRPGDEEEPAASCVREPDPPKPWSTEYSVLRNALRSEDWYVDQAHKCVIPKRSLGYSCYGKLLYVQYDHTQSCDPNSNDESNKVNSKVCSAYVSVCYRLNP